MGASMYGVYVLDKDWPDCATGIEIRNSDGVVVCDIKLYAAEAEDGSVRAQLELRSADQSGVVTTPGTWMDVERHASGWPRIMVTLDEESRYTSALRFSIDIPRTAGDTSGNTGDDEAKLAAVKSAREAIQTVRSGCFDPDNCYYPLCDMASLRRSGELADDGGCPELVPLPPLTYDRPDIGA
jgi:hypothetical protein